MALADYRTKDSPRKTDHESGTVNVWRYVGPTTDLETDRPAVGDSWADGLLVSGSTLSPNGDNPDYSELVVTTAVTVVSALLTSVLEQAHYELVHAPVERPLELHPEFRSGGTYALDATARKHIQGWKMEIDPRLKSTYKYQVRDSAGDPGAEITITGNALQFIYRLELGIEAYVDYLPVWTKTSTYRGASAPGTTEVGQKVTPGGSGYPSGYEWIKSDDSSRRVGLSSKWQRVEQWTGAKKVFVDKDEIFAL